MMTIAKKQKIERRVWNGIYTVEQVLSKIKPVNAVDVMVDFNGNLIKMSSQRYLLFSRSCTCCVCGVIGIFFAKERHSGSTRWHFNLYAIDDDGDEVLMTKDHIIPRSRGGENTLNNYQTMCTVCNGKKGDKGESSLHIQPDVS